MAFDAFISHEVLDEQSARAIRMPIRKRQSDSSESPAAHNNIGLRAEELSPLSERVVIRVERHDGVRSSGLATSTQRREACLRGTGGVGSADVGARERFETQWKRM